jgi:hypothetical protein
MARRYDGVQEQDLLGAVDIFTPPAVAQPLLVLSSLATAATSGSSTFGTQSLTHLA